MIPISREQENAEAAGNTSTPSSISFISANDHATVAINPSETGTFGTTSGNADIRFTISTNNYSGYTLSAKATSTSLDRTTDGTILALASSVTQAQFSTASNTPLNNRWGYKPNYYNSSANSSRYYPATTSSVTLDKTTAANSTAKSYTISLGARVDYSIPSGTYENSTLTLQYVANPVPYTITFDNNAPDDVVTNMPTNLTGSSSSPDTLTLPSKIPARTNYTFAGWCTVRPTEVVGGQSCSGTTFSNSGTYGMDYTANNSGTKLYAIWTSNRGCNKAATTIGTGVTATDAVCMQDINDTVIASMTSGAQHTLIDERDGKSYFIAKQADGKVWMTQNLNYNLNTSITLTHHNTDIGHTDNDLTRTWTPGAATLTNMSSWSNNLHAPMSYDGSSTYYASSNSTSNDTATTTCSDASTCMHFNAGTYYNWLAAIAGNETSSENMAKMPDSICPAGWRLQESYSNEYYAELNNLFVELGYVNKHVASGNASLLSGALNSLRGAPLYIIRSSRVNDGSLANIGSTAYYWTNTVMEAESSRAPAINSSTFYPLNMLNKGFGAPVRCVARMNTHSTIVRFHGNGSTGIDLVTRTVDNGFAVRLDNINDFVKLNYKNTGWNTSADGNGTSVAFTDYYYTSPSASSDAEYDLYAQWEPSYNITYNGNGASSALTMSVGHNAVDGESITLYAPNYSRSGYGFAGWSTTQINPDASNAATLMASAKIFGPNQTITTDYETFGVNAPVSVTLYAVWVKSSGNMQDWKGCTSLTAATRDGDTITPGSVIALTDTRDGDTYAVARLADGNCWMIENFRLDDTNSSDASKAQAFGDGFIGLAHTEDFFTNETTANTLYSTSNITGNNIAYRIPRYNNNNTKTTGQAEDGTTLVSDPTNGSIYNKWYGYGNMYTWAAALANTEYIEDTASAGTLTSICPSGWILPTHGTTTVVDYTYTKLLSSLTGTTATFIYSSSNPSAATVSKRFRTYPYNIVSSGYQTVSAMTSRETDAYLWVSYISASTSHTYGGAYRISNSGVYQTSLLRSAGVPMRCVVDKDYRIHYDGNGADAGHDMRVSDAVSSGNAVLLSAPNYRRSGYGFAGWSTTQINPDASNAATLIANATIYGPNETVTFDNVNSDITLYAVWVKSVGNLQNWSGCSALSQGSVTALKDTRDNQVYTVAKLADGKCWMIENLRLNDDHSLDYDKMQGIGGVFNGLGTSSTNFEESTLDTSLYTANPRTTNLTYISGDYQAFRFPKYNNQNTALNVEHMSGTNQNIYFYGNYYNWSAAMANTSIMNLASVSEFAGSSLCPTGWRLPTAGVAASGKEFNVLYSTLNVASSDSSNLRKFPNNFIYSGVFQSVASGTGTRGDYLSSSAYNERSAYALSFYDTTSQHNANVTYLQKYWGNSIRCIKDDRMVVTLDANDGSGRVEHVYGDTGYATTIPLAQAFMNDNSVVTSWNTQPDGSGTSYTNSYTAGVSTTLYAQWTASYRIIYDGNNADSTSNMNAFGHSGIASGGKVLLYLNNVLRADYGFLGWSTTQIDPDASNAATQIANAKILGPNEYIISNATTLGVNAPATVTLYAVWIKSSANMDNWNGCESLTAATFSNGIITPGGVIGLTDTRDNKVYAVARLSDGSCWMTEPLRISGWSSSISTTTTNKPTDGYLAKLNTSSSWCAQNSADCHERILSSWSMSPVSLQYYNWYTATAGNGTYSMTSGNAAGDICPKGWHLPSAMVNNTSDYYKLAVSLGGSYSTMSGTTASLVSERLRTYPNNFSYVGYGYSSNATRPTAYNLRSVGYYAGTNAYSNSQFGAFYIGESSVNTNMTYKYYGTTVRCVKNPKSVYYDGNGADNPSAMSVTHPSTASSTITLYPSNYHRAGYGFLGWSYTQIDPDASNAATQIANATIYGPNQTITLPSTITGDLVFYAVWAKSAGNMQDWTGCSSLSAGGVTALKDTRDNNVYAIAKLADGNCWMIENLRLNSANSTDNSKAQGFGGVFTGLANSELATFTGSTTANSLYTTDNSSSSLNLIHGGNSLQYRIPRFNDASASAISTLTSNAQNAYSYGNYYSFAAAKANTGEMATVATSEWSGTSICPKGWRLPTGGTSGANKEFEVLNTNANSGSTTSTTGIRSYPNNFLYSGYVWNGAYGALGTYGQYISSTSNNGDGFFEYQISASAVNVGRSVYRSIGDSVRCIANTGVTVTLDSNDGSGKVARINVASGTAVTLSTEIFENENHKIIAWNTTTGGTGTDYTSITPTSNITLYAKWAAAYTITYDGNNPTGTANMTLMSHTGVLNNDEIMLFANNYTRSGYGFLGWSTTQIDPDASNASTLISNAKIFGPNQSIIANSTNLGVSTPANVTLYAVWLKASGTFQNWKGCSNLTTTTFNSSTNTLTPGSFIALTDNRSYTGDTYVVARLPGGNCWMIEDARYNVSTSNITKTNTNFPTTDFLANRTNTPSTCTSNAQSCTEQIIYSNGLDQSRGAYYGWYVATAGNGFHSNNNSFSADICPAGWKMPTGGYSSAGEFNILLSNIGGSATNYTNTSSPTASVLSARLRSFPINLLYNGYTSGTNTYAYRTEGYYSVGDGWNSGTTYYKYFFGLSNDFVRIAYGQSKSVGHRLRCVYSPEVIYDGNGATSGDMAGFTRLTGTSVILRSPTFERPGYAFLGWSPTTDGSTAIFGANETVNVSTLNTWANAAGNVTLYAVWVQSAGTLQTWTGCNSLTKPSVNAAVSNNANITALTDNRDNRVYTVARLADGNCYMMENLKLGLTEISTDLTSSNTNLSSTITAATFNGWRTTATTATATAPAVEHLDTLYRKSAVDYNHCAATANTMCVDTSSTDAVYDICPKGWKLVAGGYNAGDLGGLYNIGYNTSALARKSVVTGGAGLLMNSDYNTTLETNAYYQTQKAASNLIYGPYLNSSTWNAGYQTGRSSLNPVKCVYNKPRVELTVTYGTGVSSITVNGATVPSGGKLRLDQGTAVQLVMYLKTDYAFSSWSASNATVGSSTQTTTLTLGTTTTASIVGYATFTGTYIQNLNPTLCTTTARKVYDSRDMQAYYIKRLSDGKCWMVDNLNLGAVSFYNNLTSSNTNLSSTITYSTFNGWKVTSSASTYDTGEFMVLSGTDSTTGTAYGTLYNYYAATAGTIAGSSNSTNATYDICPAGWRLPTGGASNSYEYYNLYNYYNSYSSMRASYNNGGASFNQPGWFGGGSATSNVNLGASGSFWSSNVYNSNYRYGMYVATSGSTVQRDAPMIRNGGHSIRCVLKSNELVYLQDFYTMSSTDLASVKSSMPYNTIISLKDNRDNQPYGVAKLSDGNIYMIDNLNLGDPNYPITAGSLNSSNTNKSDSSLFIVSTFTGYRLTTSNYSSYTGAGYVVLSGTDSTTGRKYGSMYNYCAATLNEICSSSNAYNATMDICPAGWRMPTGGASGEWLTLYNQYGSYANMRKAVSSGGAGIAYYGQTTPYLGPNMSQSTNCYWASTRYDNLAQNALVVYTAATGANDFRDRYYGGFIRCRLK